jgi:hypothetical protein
VATVATDRAPYHRQTSLATAGRLREITAGEVFGEHLLGATTDHLSADSADRDRIFNLGYYTWVEQQGVSIEDFTARRDPAFWTGVRDCIPAWDALIDEFNARTGALEGL